MPIIITIMIAMFLILISWTWHNLGDIEKIKKIITKKDKRKGYTRNS